MAFYAGPFPGQLVFGRPQVMVVGGAFGPALVGPPAPFGAVIATPYGAAVVPAQLPMHQQNFNGAHKCACPGCPMTGLAPTRQYCSAVCGTRQCGH